MNGKPQGPYEAFLSSVFASMGIPFEDIEFIHPSETNRAPSEGSTSSSHHKNRSAHSKSNLASSKRTKEEPSSESFSETKTSSEMSHCFQSPPGKRQKISQSFDDAVYKKVAFNKLVRTTHTSKAGLYSSASATMFFGASDDPRELCHSYCRSGVCPWKGRCRFVHDPQKVMVCSKWLHGRCNSSNCALQHHRRPELMPHCIPYQKGECNRLNCPFMHSVYNPTAPPCINFYRSYCPRGANCWRQHVRESKGNRF